MSGRTIIPIVIVTLVIAAAAAGAGYKARLNASGEPRANVSYANDSDDTEEDSSAAERMITEEELRQTTEPSLQEAEPEAEPEEKPEPEEAIPMLPGGCRLMAQKLTALSYILPEVRIIIFTERSTEATVSAVLILLPLTGRNNSIILLYTGII